MKYLQTISIAFVLVFFSFFTAPAQAHAGQVAKQVTNAVAAVTEYVAGAGLATVQVLSLGTVNTSNLASGLFQDAHCRGLNLTTDPLVAGSQCGTALGTNNAVISVSATPQTVARGQRSVISWSSNALSKLTSPNVTDSSSCAAKGGGWISISKNVSQCQFGPSGSFNTDPLIASTLFTFQGQASDGSTLTQSVSVLVGNHTKTNTIATTSTSTNGVSLAPLGSIDNPESLPLGSVLCNTLQGTGSTVVVNKAMTWNLSLGSSAGISLSNIDTSTLSIDWEGNDISTVTNSTTLSKIYTTVGAKNLTATLTGAIKGYYYSGSCTASTTVKLGSETVKQI